MSAHKKRLRTTGIGNYTLKEIIPILSTKRKKMLKMKAIKFWADLSFPQTVKEICDVVKWNNFFWK
jgi:hypothetical protein